MKKIVMTGGGTAGHVTPNIALFSTLQKEGYEISYIGSYNGIEKELIEALKSMLGIYAVVKLVAPKTIARSEGKAKRVIDNRNLY